MATYKVVLEVESDGDVDAVRAALSRILNRDPKEIDGCSRWASTILAVAETQSSRSETPSDQSR